MSFSGAIGLMRTNVAHFLAPTFKRQGTGTFSKYLNVLRWWTFCCQINRSGSLLKKRIREKNQITYSGKKQFFFLQNWVTCSWIVNSFLNCTGTVNHSLFVNGAYATFLCNTYVCHNRLRGVHSARSQLRTNTGSTKMYQLFSASFQNSVPNKRYVRTCMQWSREAFYQQGDGCERG